MAKKSKAVQSPDAKAQLEKRTDDLIDDDIDLDDDGVEDDVVTRLDFFENERIAARRRLEDYMEEKRLRDELGDDFG